MVGAARRYGAGAQAVTAVSGALRTHRVSRRDAPAGDDDGVTGRRL